MSPDELLQAAQALKTDDGDSLMSQLLLIRAQRRAMSIPEAETELLERVNQGLQPELAGPYQELITRRRAGLLTPSEHQQLFRLTHRVETIRFRPCAGGSGETGSAAPHYGRGACTQIEAPFSSLT